MQGKKIIVAADHAGCGLKKQLKEYLTELGCIIQDYGTDDDSVSVDYPEKAYLLAKGIYTGEADIGILVCGSGIGMSIAVNRYDFIRGALVCSPEMAVLARKHNNANVLILGGRLTDSETAKLCINAFLTTPFEGGRHENRVAELERMSHDFEQ